MDPKTNIPTQQQIKLLHLKQIFLAALDRDGISRAELRQKLGISFPAVSALVEELLAAGVLYEDGTLAPGERGRPRSLLRVRAEALVIPVAGLTAEGYCCSVFNCRAELLERSYLPVSGDRTLSETLCLPLQRWLESLKQRYPVTCLVLTASGNFDGEGALSSTVLGFSTPRQFHRLLRQALGLEVFIYNNADCFAYGEKYAQSLPEDYIVITAGKGVGAGIIRHGKVFGDGPLRAGEIGHISINCRGPRCACGNRGCLEGYVSIPRIRREAQELLGQQEPPELSRIRSRILEGDPGLLALIREKAELLALGISNMLAMQPVSHVVIGGGIEELGEPFLDALWQSVKTVGLRKYMDRVTVLYAAGKPENGALGGARICLDHDLNISAFPGITETKQ